MAREQGGTRKGSAKRVRETGIALVHAGELVLPAAGSEAQAEVVAGDAREAVHYHFPVEVIVQGSAGEAVDVRAAIEEAFRDLLHQVRNRV